MKKEGGAHMVSDNFISLALLGSDWLNDELIIYVARKLKAKGFEISNVAEKTENRITFELRSRDGKKLSSKYFLVFQRDFIPVLNVHNVVWRIEAR